MKIKLLLGGSSTEREVSISSGLSIYDAIKDEFDVELIYMNENYRLLSETNLNDCLVFNALHGGYGENGDLQAFLEKIKIPFTGSNSNACKLAISKNETKKIAQKEYIPTANWSMNEDDFSKKDILFPLVVKPDDQGSTIGLSIVEKESALDPAIEIARKLSLNVMIEEYVPGREITVGIIDGIVLPIVEIIPDKGFYDYDAKYKKGQSRYICPAIIDKDLTKKIQDDALKLFNAIGCSKYGRVDFRLNENKYYMLEINTHPGMTDTSLLPIAAKEYGISFKELVNRIIKK